MEDQAQGQVQGQTGEVFDDGGNEEIMIPKSRFDAINKKFKESSQREKALKAELEELQEQYKSVESKSFELNDLYEAQKERVAHLEKVIDKLIESKLEKIPEAYRDLIPENLAPDEKLEWLTKAEEKGLFAATVVGEVTIGGSSNPKPSNRQNVNSMNPFELLKLGYSPKKG
jgi:predicted nuclease with TOPRIM domain